jgi:ribosomal protein S18 acetylase RimI-like enzyme
MTHGMTIDEIAAAAGGIGQLADLLDVHWSTVCGYRRTRRGLLPVHHARTVHEALGIPLHDIRPDIWSSSVSESGRRTKHGRTLVSA